MLKGDRKDVASQPSSTRVLICLSLKPLPVTAGWLQLASLDHGLPRALWRMNEEATARLNHWKKQKASISLKSTNLPRSKQVPWPGLKSMKSEGFYAPVQEGMKIWAKPSFGPPQEHVLIPVWGSFSTIRGTTVRSHCMASTVLSYTGKWSWKMLRQAFEDHMACSTSCEGRGTAVLPGKSQSVEAGNLPR